MARPIKDGLEYFPHDVDASNDEKVEALRSLYGNDGYAFYFILLERIYRTKNAELDVSDAETIQILAKKVGVSVELFEKMLKTAIKRDCFDREEYENRKVLTSNGIKKRANIVIAKRTRMKEKYAQAVDTNADTTITEGKEDSFCQVSDAETHAESTQSKVKQSKVKQSKEEEKENTSYSQKEDATPISFSQNSTPKTEPEIPPPKPLDPDSYGFAEWFKSTLPAEISAKTSKKQIDEWADVYDKSLRLDGHTKIEIFKVCKWAREDSFWSQNFLSAVKLRTKDKSGFKHYDVFRLRMESEKNGANKKSNGNSGSTYNDRLNIDVDELVRQSRETLARQSQKP